MMWTIPVNENRRLSSAAQSNNDYEDKCFRLREEKQVLTSEKNKINDANRILTTKCANLEAALKKKLVADEVLDAEQLSSSLVLHKNKQDFEDLFRAYDTIKRENKALISKQKSSLQAISNQKKEITSLKLRLEARKSIGFTPPRRQSGGCRKVVVDTNNLVQEVDVDAPATTDDDDKENVNIALGRRSSAESQLQTLKATTPTKVGDSRSRSDVSVTKSRTVDAHRYYN